MGMYVLKNLEEISNDISNMHRLDLKQYLQTIACIGGWVCVHVCVYVYVSLYVSVCMYVYVYV